MLRALRTAILIVFSPKTDSGTPQIETHMQTNALLTLQLHDMRLAKLSCTKAFGENVFMGVFRADITKVRYSHKRTASLSLCDATPPRCSHARLLFCSHFTVSLCRLISSRIVFCNPAGAPLVSIAPGDGCEKKSLLLLWCPWGLGTLLSKTGPPEDALR